MIANQMKITLYCPHPPQCMLGPQKREKTPPTKISLILDGTRELKLLLFRPYSIIFRASLRMTLQSIRGPQLRIISFIWAIKSRHLSLYSINLRGHQSSHLHHKWRHRYPVIWQRWATALDARLLQFLLKSQRPTPFHQTSLQPRGPGFSGESR